MISIHFNNINKEKNFYINSKEDLSEILDKIIEEIEKEHDEKVYDKQEESKSLSSFITKLTETLARAEFKEKILDYFYGKEN